MPEAVRTVRVAVWGLGEHARRNTIPALCSTESTDLIGLCSRDPEAAAVLAGQLACRTYEKPADMLSDDTLDAVYIATPTALHHEQTAQVLRAGKHAWCEKPMTDSPALTAGLFDLARERGVAAMECAMYVHHPQFDALKNLLKSGRLGRLRALSARFAIPHLADDNFRYDPGLGGGALSDVGFYPVSFAIQIMGSAPETVAGTMDLTDAYPVDTGGAAIMSFANNVHATAEWGFGRFYRNEVEIWGDKGFCRVLRAFSKPASLATTIMLETAAGPEDIPVPADDHFRRMFDHFARVVYDPALAADATRLSLATATAMNVIRQTTPSP
jgi:predicted dehydrogenase